MRIRAAKTELEEAGLDAEGVAKSVSNIREEVKALSGVDVMKDENTFKSTYQILDELSAKWKDLTDIQRASLTKLLAGKRQGNIMSSLMKNFDVARDALKTSAESAGSAMAEHEKWMESFEAKTNQLKAAWESLSYTVLDSDFLKSLMDDGIVALNVLDKLTGSIGTLSSLIIGFGAFKGIKSIS